MYPGDATGGGKAHAAITSAGWTLTGMISLDLAVNAVVAGLLLGGFYAAVTISVTTSLSDLVMYKSVAQQITQNRMSTEAPNNPA
jgi:hypothetical protein